VTSQREFEQSLEALVKQGPGDANLALASPELLTAQAEAMLENAAKHRKNFVMLKLGVGLKHAGLEGYPARPLEGVVEAIGQLLQSTVRRTDSVARTGEAQFTVVTANIHADSARNFAQRICHAVADASLIKDDRIVFVASCGMVAWPEGDEFGDKLPSLQELNAIAQRRVALGMDHALTGVVGKEEEEAYKVGHGLTVSPTALKTPPVPAPATAPAAEPAAPDLATLLRWLQDGKKEQVLQHIGKLSSELQPLVDLMLQQIKH
jgi:hypothetical protein